MLLDFVLVHLLSQVSWLLAMGMVREARRSSSCTTTFWQVSCSSENCIEACYAAAALDLATGRAASSCFHPVVAHFIGFCTVKFGSCVIMHFEFL